MYKINQIKLNIESDERKIIEKVAKKIGIAEKEFEPSKFIILHKALDARDKNNICFVYNVAFDINSETLKKINKNIKLEEYTEVKFNPILYKNSKINNESNDESILNNEESHFESNHEESISEKDRPIVVGLGPAGLFAAYIFALNGLKPIVVERGKAVEERVIDVEKFFDTMLLSEESNVCFGEGGAGAFSDGKLNTNNKDKTGLYKFVLETFVKFGANSNILYENMPHIGTDKLLDIIKNMRDEIIKLGGEIYYNTKWQYKNGKSIFVDVSKNNLQSKKIETLNSLGTNKKIVIAIGNSARDTFRELIDSDFNIEAKTIAVGYRIAHKQMLINELQYGKKVCDKIFEDYDDKKNYIIGPANYKLIYKGRNNESVYSFCMCPGGFIINSSNKIGQLSINGMSYNDRGGDYANSAIVTTVNVDDIETDESLEKSAQSSYSKDKIKALKMIRFQENVEKKAFELEDGFIPYISNNENVVCDGIFKGKAKYCKDLMSVYENSGLKFDLNERIFTALNYFNKNMPGFYIENEKNKNLQYVIAGVETRTSSPIKMERDENYMSNVKNYYPCGEGLGHGGGIMSSAVDGIKVAFSIVTTIYSEKSHKNH